MTRLLEIITALFIVFILALIVGVLLPSTGHIERSAVVSKDIRHVYDIFDNYRRFPDYSMLRSYDPQLKYQQSDDNWYGPGTSIGWTSSNKDAGDGTLTLVSAKPGYNKVDVTGKAVIVWALKNNWYGTDKHFTIYLKRTGRAQKLVKITWAYDVDYGWNLISRYSGLYIHGRPDAFIQNSLKNLQNTLAAIPNINYGSYNGGSPLDPKIVSMPQQAVLLMSTDAKRNLTDIGTASDAAEAELQKTAKKLGLMQVGPRIRFTTNYGDQKYTFDVAIPVSSATVTLDGQQYTMSAPHAPQATSDLANASSTASASSTAVASSTANATSTAGASSVASAGSAAPATASSAGKAGSTEVGPQPGDLDDHGRLIINHDVRGMLAFGGTALEGVWYGSPAGIPVTRLRLKAYAETHGYPFDEVTHRPYDRQVHAYESMGPNGKPLAYDQQLFKIYLPLKAAPKQTPEQAAGEFVETPFNTPASATSAPASATSAPANATSAPATPATAG